MDEGRSVELHPRGQAYLHHNLAIVTGLCRWNRVAALPRNNPTVPTVAGKLAEPGQRDLGAARRFWRTALAVQGPLRCVYSGEIIRANGRREALPVSQGEFSLVDLTPGQYIPTRQWSLDKAE